MLATEFPLAMAPAAGRNNGRKPLVDGPRIAGNGGPEAVTDDGDAGRIDVRMRGEPRQRVLRIGNLVVAEDVSPFASAFAAAPEVEAEGGIAPGGKKTRHQFGVAVVLGSGESV